MDSTGGTQWGAVSEPQHATLEFRGNLLKGQVAEAIVEQLIAAHGYRILPYGVEKRFPGWLHRPGLEPSTAYDQIRAAPDFVVEIPTEHGGTQLHYLEVKFASNGAPQREALHKYTGFPDTILVVVNKWGANANTLTAYLAGEPLLPIHEYTHLRLEPEIVDHFARIVRQMFDWEWEETMDVRVGEEGVGVEG